MESVLLCGAVVTFKCLSLVCDILTYPLYLVLQQPWRQKQLSNRIKAKPVQKNDDTLTFRSVSEPKELHVELVRNNVDTMEKLLNYTAQRYTHKKCLGTRDILAEEDEVQSNGRVFKKYVLGEYRWLTATQVEEQAANFGRGLRALGHEPKQNIVIFAETRAEWMIAAHGCFKQNIPVVTLYATLGDDAIAHGINETEATIVVTTQDLLPKFKAIIQSCPRIKRIIYMQDQLGVKTPAPSPAANVDVIPFNKVVQRGEELGPNGPSCSPSPDDIAIIMYTSGSTGVPKGVLLTHRNMLTTVKAFSDAICIYHDDVFMGYLPLAHVFELLAESVCLLMGVPIGYSTPLTMVDSSSKIKRGTKGDVSVLHPTCLTAVPLILDRIFKGINEKVSKGSWLKRALFDFAYQYKLKWNKRGFSTPLLNRVVFGAARQLMGGRVRMIMSGGAPLSPETHELIKMCLCVQVIQGYGLTETCSAATVMDMHDDSLGRVGAPATNVDIRLVNWEEGHYRVTDRPHPRGEICVGGTNVSPGYYKNPEKTKEEFFDETGRRWFKTGDIGEIHGDGSIKIIDRKKDLVKLQAGEYVSLGKVEAQLKTCPLVENVCVYGDPTKHFTVALVVPNPGHLAGLASRLGKNDIDFELLCQDPQVEQAVLKELEEHGKKSKLARFEIPAAVKLCTEVWSPDMGLVTAAFKLKRKDIQERYQHEINRMYAS
ncbi:fatty acid CoA ligase Acsl3 [Cloeon dipterum]|uniref:fatty acid CoA ligase Acsl3 n=1 Tax=Cloeon dipterum TaxID=197152 RepID=UPI00321F97EA